MSQSLFAPQKTFLPGTSVALVADPTGPRLTILAMNTKAGVVSYLAVRQDAAGERTESEYRAEELMPPVGTIA